MSIWGRIKNGISVVADFVKSITGYIKEITQPRPAKVAGNTPPPIPPSGTRPPPSAPQPPPIDWIKINKEVRRNIRKQWIAKGFRNTSRLRFIGERIDVHGKVTARAISVVIDHKCFKDNTELTNYKDHTIKESAVLRLLTYGRNKSYLIPGKQNRGARKWLVWKHGVLHFWNWKAQGRIRIPNKGMFAVTGDDPYGIKAVAEKTIISLLKGNKYPVNIKNNL